ncbi:uncharacterized protein LOC62_07G009496 [Vanrija pseudolonga]|uniref:Uncharacterized protein n=1 Tax=Vanrija pseudolonga TaxID=143232 RepID=A0AAF1BUF6_9TREE|nr:hypothetical protein LOC62_07G009496 [Vanrija pseudolonga]
MTTPTHPTPQSPGSPNQYDDVHMAEAESDSESSTENLLVVNDRDSSGSTDASMETATSGKTDASMGTATSGGTVASSVTVTSGSSTDASFVTANSGSLVTDPATTVVAADATVTKLPQPATQAPRAPRTRTMIELGDSSQPDKPWYLVDLDPNRQVTFGNRQPLTATLVPPHAAALLERITVLRPSVLDQVGALQQMNGGQASPIKLPPYLYCARQACVCCNDAGRECILQNVVVLDTKQLAHHDMKCPVCKWEENARFPGRLMVFEFPGGQ